MGSWADYDNDGWLDLVVANSDDGLDHRNFVYRNTGSGALSGDADDAGGEGAASRAPLWGDYDNYGDRTSM